MADKTKTIKNATDKELDELLTRLRKENELQMLIGDLKRKSSSSYIPYDNLQVSTEQPIESLYHFGIMGMHWGRRKTRGASSTRGKGKNPSEDHQKKMQLKKKKLSEMSNAELKTFNERLNLEKQYKDLTKADVSAGRKFVTDLITNMAKDVARSYIKKYTNKAVESLLNNRDAAAKIVNKKHGPIGFRAD